MLDKVSVLVTGAGAPGIMGTIYSLQNNPDGINFNIITTDIKDNVVGKYLSDQFYVVPPPECKEEYINALKEVVEKEDIKVILPQTTRELWTLSENLEEFEQIGVKVVVSSLNSIRVANDKFLLVEKAKQIGIPYPRYFLTSTEEEFLAALKEIGYPQKKVVIKPRVSNGMRGLRIIVEDVWDVQRFLNEKPEGVEITLESLLQILRKGQWPELLVTEYLEGFEYSVDVFRNKKGSIAIPRLRKQIRSGITFEAEVDLREDLIEYSKKLSEALNLFYCFGFQYKLDSDGVPKILECNPRVQGTMVVSTFAGFNMIYYSVKEALGFEVDIREKVLKNGLQFKRFWGGICIENGQFIGRI